MALFRALITSFSKGVLLFSLGNYLAEIANTSPNYLMPMLVLGMLGKEKAAYFYIALGDRQTEALCSLYLGLWELHFGVL